MTLPGWLVEVVRANERIAHREAEHPQRKLPDGITAWDMIFDGRRHVLAPPNARYFQINAHDAAKRRGLVLHTRRFGDRIAVQAERKEGAA